MARLALSLLGAFTVSLDGKPLSGMQTDKVRGLLIYLAVERWRAHRRQSLAGLFWPDYPEEGARANLRQALANLRQVLGEEQNEPPFLLVERETLQLNPQGECLLDVTEFERLTTPNASARDLDSALLLYRGDFLEGFSLKDSPDFDDWTALLRERYLQLASKALRKLGAQAAQDKAYEKAISYARRRLELEPWQEDAHQQLMRFLAQNGQRTSALAQYETCKEILKEELSAKPSLETERLSEDIRAGKVGYASEAEAHLEAANPYKGLRAFQEADADDFYGRQALVEKLLGRFIIPTEALPGKEDNRFLAVVGPSGSGKTSLIKAGLIPALRQGKAPGSEKWFILEMVPGEHPFEELKAGLLRLSEKPLPSLMEQLKLDELGLLSAAQLVLPNEDDELLLVVDQFEELFTLARDRQEAAHFLDSLSSAVSDPRGKVRLIIGLRADFYDRPLVHPGLGGLMQGRTEVVLPMTAEELSSAIQKPSEKAGAVFEEGLVASIVADVKDQPGSLPLLQYALTELFERRQGNRITYQAYQALGGLLGVLGRRADEVYANLEAEGQAAARQLFLRLVALGEGTEDTRRRALRSELEALQAGEQMGEMEQVIEAFGRIRLLSFDRDPLSNTPTVEVAHEALLREWPRLHEWLEGSRADLHQQRQLSSAAREWLDSGRERSYLLVEQRLALFESWVQTTSLALTREEAEFLQASIAQREAQRHAEQERQTRERRLERRSRRVLAALALVFLLAALLSGGLAYGVYRQGQEVEKQRQAAVTQQAIAEEQKQEADLLKQKALRQASVGLAAQAIAELDGNDPERAVLLGLEALENYPYTPQAESALAQIAQEVYPYYFLNDKIGLGNGTWFSVAWSPDGKTLFVGHDAVGTLWDVDRRELVGLLPGDLTVSKADEILMGDRHKYSSYYVGMTTAAWSPDGKKIATGRCSFIDFRETGYCGLPRIWDVSTGTVVFTLTEGSTSINSLDWSPDSSLLLTANWDGGLIVWDAATGQPVLTLSFENGMGSARWSPDGKTIAIAYEENVAVWSAQDGVELYRLQQIPGADEIFWSPDGKLLATIDVNGDGLVWDLDTRSIRFKLPGELGAIQGCAWSGDSRTLMTAGNDGVVGGFDAATGVQLFHFHSAARSLGDIAFSPVTNRLAVSSIASKQGQVWDLRSKTATVRPEPVPDWAEMNGWFMPNELPWSPDGTQLASRGFIWDAASGKKLVKLYNFREGIVYDEGQLLASREEVAAGRTYQRAQNVDASGYAAWSPDGRMYISTVYGEAGSTRSAYIWDTETFKIITEIKLKESQQPLTFGWSPDGTKLAVAPSPGKLLYVFDTHTFQELFSVGDGTSRTFKPSWSPDGTFLTAGLRYPDPITNTHILIWDGNTGALVKELPSQDGFTLGATWSPDGKSLAVTYEKGVVKIWDTATWQVRLTFAGHTDVVMWAAWSPDGKRLVSCDASGLIKMWNAADGQEVMSIKASGAVWSVHWSPDGKMISAAGTIILPIIHQAWTSTEDLLAYVKANLVWRELSAAEREQYGLPEK